jgi:dynein heavy chain
MPATEVYGAQPPIELLRLLIDKKGMYEREEWSWKVVKDTTVMCAAAPPGGGR